MNTAVLETKTQNKTKQEEEIKLKYCLYARKSTESEEKQVLSIDSQIKEMLELASRERIEVVEIKKESHSAKDTGTRPVFNELVTEIKQGKFNGVLCWAPDRLSRNAGDLGAVVDLMDQGRLTEIRTYSQKFTNNPNEKFLLMILGSQAKLENDNKGVNVKRGLKAKVEQGLWPCMAPIGYRNENIKGREGHLMIDPKVGPLVKQMFEKVAYEKMSGRSLYMWLRDEIGYKNRNGNPLALSTIHRTLENPFYTGKFEYPKDSGKWYKGQYKALISEELYEATRKQLSRNSISWKTRHDFTFTRMMVCGKCGSLMSGLEKVKKLKNGGENIHIYYGCSRGQDRNCDNRYINEKDLVKQLLKLIDEVNLDDLGMKESLEKEMVKYNKFRMMVLNEKKENLGGDLDLKNYAKYILKKGETHEIRSMLENLKNKIVILGKTLSIKT